MGDVNPRDGRAGSNINWDYTIGESEPFEQIIPKSKFSEWIVFKFRASRKQQGTGFKCEVKSRVK